MIPRARLNFGDLWATMRPEQPCPVSHAPHTGTPTSKAAAKAIEPSIYTLRFKVREAIRASVDGLTDEEGIERTGIPASTYRPRRVECVEAGLVVDTGRTRATNSGRQAVVWGVAAKGVCR